MTVGQPRLPADYRLLDGVIQSVKMGALVVDAGQRVVLWNRWMEQHAQRSADSVLGRQLQELFPDMVDSRTLAAIDSALRNNFAALISQTLNRSPFPLYATPADADAGKRIQQAVQVMPLSLDGLQRHCLVQVIDVSAAVARETRLRTQALELQAQAYADGLTGIANRRRFDHHLETELRRTRRGGAPLSLLMIDVDYFKAYNDRYGHQRGDTCLTRVAMAMGASIERPADLLARYGGEEFAVILPETDAEGARKVAERMRAAVSTLAIEHAGSGSVGHITISVGSVTRVPTANSDAVGLLAIADRALYQAKHAGRNCVVAAAPPPESNKSTLQEL